MFKAQILFKNVFYLRLASFFSLNQIIQIQNIIFLWKSNIDLFHNLLLWKCLYVLSTFVIVL